MSGSREHVDDFIFVKHRVNKISVGRERRIGKGKESTYQTFHFGG